MSPRREMAAAALQSIVPNEVRGRELIRRQKRDVAVLLAAEGTLSPAEKLVPRMGALPPNCCSTGPGNALRPRRSRVAWSSSHAHENSRRIM